MAQERSDIITDDALKAPLIMAENLQVEYDWLMKVSKAGREASESVDQSASTKQLQKDISNLSAEQTKLLKVQGDIAAAAAKTTKANIAEAQALNTNRAAYAQLRTEEERTSKAGKDLLKTIQEQEKKLKDAGKETVIYTGSMAKLKGELKGAKDEMVAISRTLGEDSEEFKQAAARAGELQAKLNDVNDAAKVASGDTAYQKLGAQFSLLGDKVKGLDFKGAALQAKNMTATMKGMNFKSLTEGVGGFGKAMVQMGLQLLKNPYVLLAAITIGLVLALNALKDKLIPLVKLFEIMGKGLDFVVQKVKDFSDSLGLSAFAVEDNAKRVLAANEKTKKSMGDKYDKEIEILEASGKATIQTELAKQRMFENTSVQSAKALQAQKDAGAAWNDDLEKQLQEQYDMARDANHKQQLLRIAQVKDIEQIQDDLKKVQATQFEARNKLEQQQIDNAIKTQEAIKNTEGKSYEERIAASVKAEKLRIEKINKERDLALAKSKPTSEFDQAAIDTQTAIRKKAESDILEVRRSGAAEQRKLLVDSIEEEIALHDEMANNEKATLEQRVDALTDSMDKRIDVLDIGLRAQLITQKEHDKEVTDLFNETTDKIIALTLERQQKLADVMQTKEGTGRDTELGALEEQLAAQTITYKDYTKERERIQKESDARMIQNLLDTLTEEKELRQKLGQDTTAVDAQIAATQLQISSDKNAKRIEGEQLVQEKLKELQTEGVAGILEIIDNFNAAADEKRAEEMERIQTNLENDLELVGTNEAAKAELKNKAAIEQDKLRKEQAAADRKRAIFEKATAAISIGINTAKGIGMALGNYPPPVSFVLAALVGVLGAIQLGVVLSKPIPSYARGTKGHKGGLARVGEEGRELIVEPSGNTYLSPDKESFLNLPPKTKVLPHAETINMLARNAVRRIDSTRGTEQDLASRNLERKLDQLNYTIRNKKEVHINYTRSGAEAMFKSAESKIKFLNEFYY